MRLVLLLSLVISTLTAFSESREAKPYDGYQVWEISAPQTDAQVDFLQKLQRDQNFIFGQEIVQKGRLVTIALRPDSPFPFEKVLNSHGLTRTQVLIPHMQQIIDEQQARARHALLNNQNFDFDIFNEFDAIQEQMQVWSNSCPEGLVCDLQVYGTTHEGRPINYIKIGPQGGSENAFWIMGTVHAREWLATATVLKIMDRLWSTYGTDPAVTHLLDSYDWYFTPVVNGDGYQYTFDNQRLWRKNRGPTRDPNCIGTDLNRNFDVVGWGTDGTVADDPCDFSLYPGDSPASELETQAVQNEILRISQEQRVIGMVDVHTFAQMWLTPWGTTENFDENEDECRVPSDFGVQLQVANAASDAVEATFETIWERGTTCDILYPMSGGSIDWSYEKAGILYSYLPELRGPFFITGEAAIDLSYQEIWNGLVAMVAEIEVVEGLN